MLAISRAALGIHQMNNLSMRADDPIFLNQGEDQGFDRTPRPQTSPPLQDSVATFSIKMSHGYYIEVLRIQSNLVSFGILVEFIMSMSAFHSAFFR